MTYLVRLTDRAVRDLEAIYEFIGAGSSDPAFAWFNELVNAVQSLERFPERASITRESKKVRHWFFGRKPNIYRIMFSVDKRNSAVNILHIRHSARAPLPEEPEQS